MLILRRALLSLSRNRPRIGFSGVELIRPTAEDYRRLAAEVDATLLRDDINVWLPRCVDNVHGGFTASYSDTWQPLPRQTKSVVFQARMTWFCAQVSERMTGASAARFQDYARHGVKILHKKMWDAKDGGFFWNLNNDGSQIIGREGEKYAYGDAFAIYACANVARVVQDGEALELAQRTFRCLDDYAHDAVHGGYFETRDGDGPPQKQLPSKAEWIPVDTPYGYKSTNTHIHLLEAFIELYRAWPDPLVRARLEELVQIACEKLFVLPGCMQQFFTRDFRAVPNLISYGHDVESAYLLIEAARVLGRPDDPALWEIARQLTDNALDHAFDAARGGFYDYGPAFQPATSRDKVWWAQAEILNGLIHLHEKFGAGDARYWTAFVRTWQYITQHQIDPKHHGWHRLVWPDGKPLPGPKGENWKDIYHTGRALLNTSRILRRLGQEPLPFLEP